MESVGLSRATHSLGERGGPDDASRQHHAVHNQGKALLGLIVPRQHHKAHFHWVLQFLLGLSLRETVPVPRGVSNGWVSCAVITR